MNATSAALALLAIVALAAGPAGATSATTSTGDVDTYNMPVAPGVPPSCDVRDVPRNLSDCVPSTITCPAFGTAQAVLRLTDPGSADVVSLTVPAEYGTTPIGSPEAVATSATPVAYVPFRWSGCSAQPIVIVTGILVDGERPYELTIEPYAAPGLGSLCVGC